MDGDPEVVVIGGGLAGQRVCETLRLLGHEGRVRMLCEERHAPYDRPPLSKGVLSGGWTARRRCCVPSAGTASTTSSCCSAHAPTRSM